jgi:IS1 family transposase
MDLVSSFVNAARPKCPPIEAQEFGSRFAKTERELVAARSDFNTTMSSNDNMRAYSIAHAANSISVL